MFCENKTDCRRKQLLAYFGEVFLAKDCHKTCDNCKRNSSGPVRMIDLTGDAINVMKLVHELQNTSVTLSYCVDVFRGSRISKILQNGHDHVEWYGTGKQHQKHDAERLFRELVLRNILTEEAKTNYSGFVNSYIKTGPKYYETMNDKRFKFEMALNEKENSAPADIDNTELYTDKTKKVKKTKTKTTPLRLEDKFDDEVDFELAPAPRAKPKKVSNAALQARSGAADADELKLLRTYESLKVLRADIARQMKLESVKTIFDDATLLEMAKLSPSSIQELSAVMPDIEEFKLNKYGGRFVALIRGDPQPPSSSSTSSFFRKTTQPAKRSGSMISTSASISGVKKAPMRKF